LGALRSFPAESSAARQEPEQLFRSAEHHFRIKFPAGWDVKAGDGPNVVQKATHEGSTILVLVRTLITTEALDEFRREDRSRRQLSPTELRAALENQLDTRSFTPAELNALAREQATALTRQYPGAIVEETGMKHLANRPAVYARLLVPYRVLDREFLQRIVFFQVIYKGRLYQMQAGTRADRFQTLLPTILASISTFVIEDW
jgi:hypothetical protein